MNCRETAKFLYAFADGELETCENLHVLEHINMCPECCGKVSIQQQLKGAIAVAFGNESAPAYLRERIGGSVRSAERALAWPSSRLIRLWRPTAMAAVLTLAAVGLWNTQYRFGGPAAVIAGVQFTDTTPMAGVLANNVYEMHRTCSAKGEAHQNEALPRDGLAAARALCRLLDYPMLQCGKLDRRTDTAFVSANCCGLEDCRGTIHNGGHLIYRFKDGPLAGRAISLISVTHLDELKSMKKHFVGDREYCIIKPPRAAGSATVILFDCPKASHLVCLEATPAETLEFVANMRPVAREHADQSARSAALLAGLRH